jgi:hypothetical protein
MHSVGDAAYISYTVNMHSVTNAAHISNHIVCDAAHITPGYSWYLNCCSRLTWISIVFMMLLTSHMDLHIVSDSTHSNAEGDGYANNRQT